MRSAEMSPMCATLPLAVMVMVFSCTGPVDAQESQTPTSVVEFPSNEKPAVGVSTVCSQPGCSCEGKVAKCDCNTKVRGSWWTPVLRRVLERILDMTQAFSLIFLNNLVRTFEWTDLQGQNPR